MGQVSDPSVTKALIVYECHYDWIFLFHLLYQTFEPNTFTSPQFKIFGLACRILSSRFTCVPKTATAGVTDICQHLVPPFFITLNFFITSLLHFRSKALLNIFKIWPILFHSTAAAHFQTIFQYERVYFLLRILCLTQCQLGHLVTTKIYHTNYFQIFVLYHLVNLLRSQQNLRVLIFTFLYLIICC